MAMARATLYIIGGLTPPRSPGVSYADFTGSGMAAGPS